MKALGTALDGVVLIVPDIYRDERGYFLETWNSRKLGVAGIDVEFVQDNLSISKRGTLRGLHFQIEQAQGKLVRVVSGEVFDVAVDIRRSSPNFGKWVGEILSEGNQHQLWIPPGFAHGFLVLSEIASFEYKCSAYYAPEHERSIRWNDPDIGIPWPLPDGQEPALSAKDAEAPFLDDAETCE